MRPLAFYLGEVAARFYKREPDPKGPYTERPKLATQEDVDYFKNMYPDSFSYLGGTEAGALRVIALADPGEHRRVLWVCRCSCSRYVIRKTSNLKRNPENGPLQRSCSRCADVFRLKKLLKSKIFWWRND